MANRDFRGRNQQPRGTNQSYTRHPFPDRWRPSSGPQLPGPRFFAQGEVGGNRMGILGPAPAPQQHPQQQPQQHPSTSHINMPHNYENPRLPRMRQQLPPQGEMRHEFGLWNQTPNTQGHLTEHQMHFGPTITSDRAQQQTRHIFQTQQQHQLSQSYNQFGAHFTNPRQNDPLLGVVHGKTTIEDHNIITRDLLAKLTISDENSQPTITGAIPSHGIQNYEVKPNTLGANQHLPTRNQEGRPSFAPSVAEGSNDYIWTLWLRRHHASRPVVLAGVNTEEDLERVLVENNAGFLTYSESYFFRMERPDLPDLSNTRGFKNIKKEAIVCFWGESVPETENEPGPLNPNETLAKQWKKLLQVLMRVHSSSKEMYLYVIIGAYVKYDKMNSKIALMISTCLPEDRDFLRSSFELEGINTFIEEDLQPWF